MRNGDSDAFGRIDVDVQPGAHLRSAEEYRVMLKRIKDTIKQDLGSDFERLRNKRKEKKSRRPKDN